MSLEASKRRFTGMVYRAHNPRWAYAATSGEGAARHGGRFNPGGRAALYTALDPKTAWMEAQQGLPFKAQPMTLVAYRVNCEPVADLCNRAFLSECSVEPVDLACAWEDLASRGEKPPSWALAEELIERGYRGALIPSFAPGAEGGGNLVLWDWCDARPCSVEVIDDFGRLPRDGSSWN